MDKTFKGKPLLPLTAVHSYPVALLRYQFQAPPVEQLLRFLDIKRDRVSADRHVISQIVHPQIPFRQKQDKGQQLYAIFLMQDEGFALLSLQHLAQSPSSLLILADPQPFIRLGMESDISLF